MRKTSKDLVRYRLCSVCGNFDATGLLFGYSSKGLVTIKNEPKHLKEMVAERPSNAKLPVVSKCVGCVWCVCVWCVVCVVVCGVWCVWYVWCV
jgi:hypothetical protein